MMEENQHIKLKQEEVRIFNMRIYSVISQMPPIELGGFRIHLDGLHRDVWEKGQLIIEHEHPSYEFAWLECGRMNTVCNETRVGMSSSDEKLLVIAPLILHRRVFEGAVNVNTSMVWRIDARDESAQKRLECLPELIRTKGYCAERTPWMNVNFAEIERQLEMNRPLSAEIIRNSLRNWIAGFLQEHFSELLAENWESLIDVRPMAADKVTAIKMFIENRMNRVLLLEHLSEEFGLSSRQLNRIFQAETGISIKKYYDRQRMLRAEYLLLNTSAPIAEIANSIGFSSSRLFNAFFHRHHRLSPLEFRNSSMS